MWLKPKWMLLVLYSVDFHEYAEGNLILLARWWRRRRQSRYPSDVITFFKLAKAHGIKRIMVRPGPYVNAEWGFFGIWGYSWMVSQKIPRQSYERRLQGLHTKLFDYLDPQFLKSTKTWFETLYNQVLKFNIGEGQPIVFLQVDNETNYQWQSIYNQDYGPRAYGPLSNFLKDNYGDLGKLNSVHHTGWANWNKFSPLWNRAKILMKIKIGINLPILRCSRICMRLEKFGKIWEWANPKCFSPWLRVTMQPITEFFLTISIEIAPTLRVLWQSICIQKHLKMMSIPFEFSI